MLSCCTMLDCCVMLVCCTLLGDVGGIAIMVDVPGSLVGAVSIELDAVVSVVVSEPAMVILLW